MRWRRPQRPGGIVGVVLAGGLGRRLGGDKAIVNLAGRPLLSYPLSALRDAGLAETAVVAKGDTQLPALVDEVPVWVEPDTPRHPLTGIVHALRAAQGRAVFVCAADMVLLDAATVRRVVGALAPGDRAVVARSDDQLQPLCAVYAPEALGALAHFDPQVSLVGAVHALAPRVVDFEDATPFFNVNAPEDVLRAGALLQLSRT